MTHTHTHPTPPHPNHTPTPHHTPHLTHPLNYHSRLEACFNKVNAITTSSTCLIQSFTVSMEINTMALSLPDGGAHIMMTAIREHCLTSLISDSWIRTDHVTWCRIFDVVDTALKKHIGGLVAQRENMMNSAMYVGCTCITGVRAAWTADSCMT